MNTGCPRSSIHETALQLLQVNDKSLMWSLAPCQILSTRFRQLCVSLWSYFVWFDTTLTRSRWATKWWNTWIRKNMWKCLILILRSSTSGSLARHLRPLPQPKMPQPLAIQKGRLARGLGVFMPSPRYEVSQIYVRECTKDFRLVHLHLPLAVGHCREHGKAPDTSDICDRIHHF